MSSNAAFLFLKPHTADNEDVRALVQRELKKRDIKIIAEGEILAKTISDKRLIDNHYYSIASKATLQQPNELPVPVEKFKNKFLISWEDALEKNHCLNAAEAGKKWGLDGLAKRWREAQRNDRVVKLGGGFYCADMDGFFVFNGFFMSMREKYVASGKMIYYFKVEWSPNVLSWGEFRLKVLGKTNPAEAHKDSIRGIIYADWEKLGLPEQPDTGDNGIHGSASAFEALIERMNWCGDELKSDAFGRLMLDAGVTEESIKKWSKDPQVVVSEDRKMGSIFDAFEDMDSGSCVDEALRIQRINNSPDKSCGHGMSATIILTIVFATVGAYFLYKARKQKGKSKEMIN